MTDVERIERRVAGRKIAAEVLELLGDGAYDAVFMSAFIEALSPKQQVATVVSKPLTPIARLGAEKMPFGQHVGKTFDEVPLAYLEWLCQSQEDFYKYLRQYLQHPDLQTRRGCD